MCPDNQSLGLLFPYTNKLDTSTVSRIDPSILGSNASACYSQNRSFHFAPAWRGQEPSSKVEETVNSLKEEKEEKEKEKMTVAVTSDIAKAPEKAVAQKPTLWQKIKAEMLHYYHGFRLLGLDMKISAKLLWRLLKGKELTRREHRLVKCLSFNGNFVQRFLTLNENNCPMNASFLV